MSTPSTSPSADRSASTSARARTAQRPPTRTTTSADGTEIALETVGQGPALVLVDGAMCSRAMGPAREAARLLADRFTVTAYDRRGRGESGTGTSPYAMEREIEDLRAVLDAVGGHAHVLGFSSGAALALEAARRGAPVDRLVVFEAPFIVDDSHAPHDPQLPERLQEMVDRGQRGKAVSTFMRVVGAPAPMIAVMHLLPVWRKLTAVAHTLPYDLSIVIAFDQGRPLPAGYYDEVSAPTLVLLGGRSPAYMRAGQAAIVAAVRGARLEVLPGQTHMVKPAVLAPVVADFLA